MCKRQEATEWVETKNTQIKARECEKPKRVHSVKIMKSQSSRLVLQQKALPTGNFKRRRVFLRFERLLSSSLFILILQKSNDKTEGRAAACWRLHPGCAVSVCSLIFQSFRKEVTFAAQCKQKNTHTHSQRGCIYTDVCTDLSPRIGANGASGGEVVNVKEGSDSGGGNQCLPSFTAWIKTAEFWFSCKIIQNCSADYCKMVKDLQIIFLKAAKGWKTIAFITHLLVSSQFCVSIISFQTSDSTDSFTGWLIGQNA